MIPTRILPPEGNPVGLAYICTGGIPDHLNLSSSHGQVQTWAEDERAGLFLTHF